SKTVFEQMMSDGVDLACGAKTRAGTPCKRRDIWGSGRCKLHGGLSTGARTKEGKEAIAESIRRRARKNQSP
ncbi:MAG: HGGxSTG domain-containing protein, partial [Mariprofundaceae bacterium]